MKSIFYNTDIELLQNGKNYLEKKFQDKQLKGTQCYKISKCVTDSSEVCRVKELLKGKTEEIVSSCVYQKGSRSKNVDKEFANFQPEHIGAVMHVFRAFRCGAVKNFRIPCTRLHINFKNGIVEMNKQESSKHLNKNC